MPVANFLIDPKTSWIQWEQATALISECHRSNGKPRSCTEKFSDKLTLHLTERYSFPDSFSLVDTMINRSTFVVPLPRCVSSLKNLVSDRELRDSAVVANCNMNRERDLYGTNGYQKELHFDALEFLISSATHSRTANWLDLCCGTGKAILDAAAIIERDVLPISIVGVDLVNTFRAANSNTVQFVDASLDDWEPNGEFDLITCVHGLHYVGDKLKLIAKAAQWLKPKGRFVANLDANNLRHDKRNSRSLIRALRDVGFEYSSRRKLIQLEGKLEVQFPFDYLGADDQAGPNYTGQPAVNSHYADPT